MIQLMMVLPAALALSLVGVDFARAFHSGGTGECDGCHSMHNYEDGVPLGPANRYLLKGSDASSTCLNCHQQMSDPGPTSYHVSTPDGEMPQGTPPKQLSPGGDFGWLKKSYSWIPALGSPFLYSEGDRHGHNINANDYGYLPDSQKTVAPGGNYPAGALGCVSCHDPHGRYRRNMDGSITTSGNPVRDSGSYATSPDPTAQYAAGVFRLLGGSGYRPSAVGAGFAFTYGPPAAVAPAEYNRAETTSLTRVAYGTGFSEWCMNCHPNIHDGVSAFEHRSPGIFGGGDADYYNSYVKTGDLTGNLATAYFSLVPIEAGINNYQTLRNIVTNTPTKGADRTAGDPGVMCLSCHRAHAGGWDGIMRWNPKTDYIVYNGNYSQEGLAYQPYGQGRTEAEALQAYYQTPAGKFSAFQQKLCYKCHESIPN